ncbi:UNVERIFIED_CONTAM: hypothetical protein BEN50_26085 [Euhalothece sp. KZN 001]
MVRVQVGLRPPPAAGVIRKRIAEVRDGVQAGELAEGPVIGRILRRLRLKGTLVASLGKPRVDPIDQGLVVDASPRRGQTPEGDRHVVRILITAGGGPCLGTGEGVALLFGADSAPREAEAEVVIDLPAVADAIGETGGVRIGGLDERSQGVRDVDAGFAQRTADQRQHEKAGKDGFARTRRVGRAILGRVGGLPGEGRHDRLIAARVRGLQRKERSLRRADRGAVGTIRKRKTS